LFLELLLPRTVRDDELFKFGVGRDYELPDALESTFAGNEHGLHDIRPLVLARCASVAREWRESGERVAREWRVVGEQWDKRVMDNKKHQARPV
jgi:hypothetical protein